jgi:hypothetical protein
MARLSGWLRSVAVPRVAFAAEVADTYRTRARLARFHQRHSVVRRFPEPFVEGSRARVLAIITHVTSAAARTPEVNVERLTRTVNGLVESLGHTELEIVVNTMLGRHVAEDLPDHLRSRVDVREHTDVDPMLLGFAAQDEFAANADSADWFLFLEDDIVLNDSLLLEKLDSFNRGAPDDALLLPHRYELWRGRKMYIDLMSREKPDLGAWNRLTMIEIDGWRFAEFENPHSGCYFLSRSQLRHWLDTGRHWRGKISLAGPRESAATGSLGEAFRLYKPHPANLRFLEVRHWDTAYSERLFALHG